MDARTLTALKASIEKWERNAVAETPGEYTLYYDNCPLCHLFLNNDVLCAGCPVSDAGYDGCFGSPYYTAETACVAWADGDGTAEAAHEAARDEAAFLKSLLPAGEDGP